MVTIDAAGGQTAIVQALRKANADCLLALKGHQGTLHRQVKAAFDEAERSILTPAVADRCETVECHGGRRERRLCTGAGRPRPAQPGPRAGGAPGPRRPPATLGALLHLEPAPERRGPAGTGARPLGGGNGLHRTLDLQFREADCRMRKGNAPAVMAVLRRAALNLVRTIQRKLETDVSIGLLRDRIGRQPWILAAALP